MSTFAICRNFGGNATTFKGWCSRQGVLTDKNRVILLICQGLLSNQLGELAQRHIIEQREKLRNEAV